ncbi:MAG: hypothetical protein ACJ72W_28910 [Actinoallomurus sp.]
MGGAALVLMIGLARAGTTANAAPDPAGTTSSTARLSDGRAVDSASAAKKVADYWTNAKPAEMPSP